MPSTSDETAHPGAGTLYVYGALKRGMSPGGGGGGGRGSRPTSRAGKKGSKERGRGESPFPLGLVRWEDLLKHHEEPQTAQTADSLLRQGVAEYTYLPQASGGVLGRGKFSTVYKVLGQDGSYYALKHTPLYPHHPLISARLLREPTLLAELPSHPCLIGVEGWVKTEGHFYLIEQYASSHVPLSSLPLPLQPSRAAYILDQLVSVIRDTLHEKGRVCHRDLKGENVMIDGETGEILILDLGLATRFSASEPKLTTCCGSPAFHSPEIVLALARPPGEVTYYGPELDIWCIALILLSLLLQVRFPLGPKHTSTHVMRQRVMDRLQELDELYPPHAPWRPPRRFAPSYSSSQSQSQNDVDPQFEKTEWTRVRRALKDFLEIDGNRRMDKFNAYQLGEKIRQRVQDWQTSQDQEEKKFKSVSFVPTQPKYTLPIHLEEDDELLSKDRGRMDQLVLKNPTNESERRTKSYIKYLLRSAGILYHLLPSTHKPSNHGTPTKEAPTIDTSATETTIFQLVVPIPEGTVPPPVSDPQIGWFPSLFSFHRKASPAAPLQSRSASMPPSKRSQASSHPSTGENHTTSDDEVVPKKSLRCYIKLEYVPGTPGPIYHSPIADHDHRRESAETFTSFRDGCGGNLAPLQPVTTNTSTQSTVTNLSYAAAPGSMQNNPFPSSVSAKGIRSASASRPNPTRPLARRSSSQASPHPAARPTLPRVASGNAATNAVVSGTALNNMTGLGLAPLSPLSRKVSLPPSPTASDGVGLNHSLSRAPSRASSRSRKATSQYNFGFHALNRAHTHEGAGGRIIIHLSDPRVYHVLKTALDVRPASSSWSPTYTGTLGNVNGGGHHELSPLTPTITRRPSLAPSLTMSVPDQDVRQRCQERGFRNGGRSDSETEPELEPESATSPKPKSGPALIPEVRRGERVVEEERGRARSKEDCSSMTIHLQKVKSRNSTKSRRTIESVNEDAAVSDNMDGRQDKPGKSEVKASKKPKHVEVKIRDQAMIGHDNHIHSEVGDGDGEDDGALRLKAEIKQTQSRSQPQSFAQTRPKLRDRDRSKSRSRGLLDVLFGKPPTPTSTPALTPTSSATSSNSNSIDDGSVSPPRPVSHARTGLGGGYGRAARRSSSVPPYMGETELVQHHNF